jgi:hypothetical protein
LVKDKDDDDNEEKKSQKLCINVIKNLIKILKKNKK